jgi:excisionase family DNA binding protein
VTRSTTAPLLDAWVAEFDAADEDSRHELAERLRPYLAREREVLLDAEQKARQLGLHPNTLVRMARAGRVGGARKVGREWRFPVAELEILPAAGERHAATPTAMTSRARPAGGAAAAAIRGSS